MNVGGATRQHCDKQCHIYGYVESLGCVPISKTSLGGLLSMHVFFFLYCTPIVTRWWVNKPTDGFISMVASWRHR